MIDFIIWIVMGGFIGWLASRLMGTSGQQGMIMDIIVGIVGSFIGGWIGSFFGANADLTSFNIWSLLWALLGAIVLLAIFKFFRRGSAT